VSSGVRRAGAPLASLAVATNLLTARTGRQTGSRPSRRLRNDSVVPGVVYGLGAPPEVVSVDLTDLRVVLSTDAGLNALITLRVDGSDQLCLLKDLQRHPVSRSVLHVDFLRIDERHEVELEVPLVLTGEAKKVSLASGMVDQVMHQVPVRAKPGDIPAEVYADVSDPEVGSSLRVAAIDLPMGVSPSGAPDAPFAVGLITRSTKEYLRQLKEEAGEEQDDILAEY